MMQKMKIFKIALLILLTTQTEAQNSKWSKLKSIKAYPPTAYNLKEGVEYLELRTYHKAPKEKRYSKKYRVEASMYKKPLNSFPPKLVRKFKKLTPNLSKEADIKRSGVCLMFGCSLYISNGFMIDSNHKLWRMNEVADIIDMLGKIDTPAELKIVLWLHETNRDANDYKHKDIYKKSAKGYTVISKYTNRLLNAGDCGEFTYRLEIDEDGNILERKLLKKRALKDGCLMAD